MRKIGGYWGKHGKNTISIFYLRFMSPILEHLKERVDGSRRSLQRFAALCWYLRLANSCYACVKYAEYDAD